jgi:dephospho-CoA kinase
VYKVGLTGNIGSGKSTVARVFKTLGVPVFFADYEARQCYYIPDVKQQVITAFGAEAYTAKGNLNAPYIAQIVFSDSGRLKDLNDIIHPGLRVRFNEWAQKNEKRNARYVVMEAAILFESGLSEMVDAAVCVHASQKQRMTRVMRRDGMTTADIQKRMDSQWPDKRIIELSDYCIHNKDRRMILSDILDLHILFMGKA